MRTRTFHHDGVTIVYDEVGDSDAPVVVLLHGGTGSREHWCHLPDRLASDFRVIAVDLRGHGDSDRAPGRYSVPDYGGDIAALCEEVAGGPAVLVGHSLGGLVAAYVAATRAEVVAGALLEDPPLFIIDPDVWPATVYGVYFPMLRQAMLTAHTTDDPVSSLRTWLRSLPPLGDRGSLADILGSEGVERAARSWARCDPDVLAGVEEDAVDKAMWGDHDVDAPISCPVTVVRADPALMPAFWPEHEQRFRLSAPQASFVVADRSGHTIHEERPEWFTGQVVKFLADL